MSKHTKGPWDFTDTVVWVPVQVGYPDDYEWEQQKIADTGNEDDARLIAAAPELLEACRIVDVWLDEPAPPWPDKETAEEAYKIGKQLAEAIAKAESK